MSLARVRLLPAHTSVVPLRSLTSIMSYYAVRAGRQVGIFRDWYVRHPAALLVFLTHPHTLVHTRNDCQRQVSGYSGAEYKKFKTIQDAQAFITDGQHTRHSGGAARAQRRKMNPMPRTQARPRNVEPVWYQTQPEPDYDLALDEPDYDLPYALNDESYDAEPVWESARLA